MNLTLYLPPNKTPVLTLYGRLSGTQVGSTVTGVEGSATVYVFNITQADGDYNVALTGISNPAGPRFALRKQASGISVAESWEILDNVAYDPDIPSSTPPQVTGFIRTFDKDGVLEVGVSVFLQTANMGEDSVGIAMDDTEREGVSDSLGVVAFTGLFPGATYIAKKGTSTRKFYVTVPKDAESPCSLPSIVG